MNAPEVDREKVLKFFNWMNQELRLLLVAIGCLIIASWITYLGVAVATRNAEKAWALLITSAISAVLVGLAALIVRSAMRSERSLHKLHSELKSAKDAGFAIALVHSFSKAGARLDGLLELGRGWPPGLELEAASSQDLIRTLRKKSVFLYGGCKQEGFIKFLFAGQNIVVEYSPIHVAVLYLTTNSELIAYCASLDLVNGNISCEEISHVPLEDVAVVKAEPVHRRFQRKGNEALFQEYERIIRNHPLNELVSIERRMRVVRVSGEDLVLPAGDPGYGSSFRRVRDGMAKDEAYFAAIAEEVSRRISEAKAALESQ